MGERDPINDPITPVALTTATPYSSTLASVNLATVESTDPMITCKTNAFTAAEGRMAETVWYTYTTGPAVEYVNIKATEASFVSTGFDTVLAVWTGDTTAGFRMVTGGCNDDGVPTPNAQSNNFSHIAGLRLAPNTTYSIEVAFNSSATTAIPATSVLKLDMAAATQIVVDTLSDPVPVLFTGWPASNPCTAPTVPGTCSLRTAVETAAIASEQTQNGVAAGAAVIVGAGTYVLSPWATTPGDASVNHNQDVGGGDIDVWASMGIYGAGIGQTIIQPPVNDRVFSVGNVVTFSGTAPPGIVANAFRINKVNIILRDVTLMGPGSAVTPAPTGPSTGGLVTAGGNLNAFERVEFTGGYTVGNGGGLSAPVPVQVRESRFANNTANFSSANTPGSGGAIALLNSPDTAYAEVRDSTFTGNVANANLPASGGGAIADAGYLVLINSTLSGNSTKGYGGGVLITRLNQGEPLVDIRNSTIADNTADSDGDGVGFGGGVYIDPTSSSNGTITPIPYPTQNILTNSIIANNLLFHDATNAGSNCAVTPYAPGAPSVLLNVSYSITNTAGTGVCAFTGAGNIAGVDPLLSVLANNGGTNQTRALQAGSPAVDAGNPAGCTGHTGNLLTTDERGFPRPTGLRCDMGAFELTGVTNAPGTPDLADASDTGDSNTDNLTTTTKPTFTGTCTADGDAVTVVADGGVSLGTGNCNGGSYSATLTTALMDGVHAVTAFESNANGPSPSSAALTITVDTVGPVITFTSTPAASATDQDSEFDFTVEGSRPSQCKLDNEAFADCDGTWFETVDLGTHTFVVRAFDAAGAIGTASYTWTIGVSDAPSAPVLAAASDSGSSNSDGITKADPLVFQDTCTNGDSIQLYDGATALASALICANGAVSFNVAGLAEGSHAISATATRGATAESAHGTSSTIVVDHTAPVLTLDSTPQASMISTTATFMFHTDDSSATTCQLDGGAIVACTSPQTYSGLAISTHTFAVASTDLAGNAATAQNFAWTVVQPNASGAPMLAPSDDSGRSNADGVTNAAATAFIGACTDGDSVQLYDGNTAVGTAAICTSGSYSIALAGLAEGNHSVTVTSTRNGIESAKSPATAVVIDRTPPSVPSLTGNGEPVELTVTVSGLAEPNALVSVLDGVAPVCTATADSEANFSCSGSLAGGDVRSLTAVAADLAGNTSATSAAYQVNADHDRVFRDGFGD